MMRAADSRLTTSPGVTPAKAGTQWATSKRARGSPTSEAIAAEPGSSIAVLPSGTMRASNWLAAVTPSTPPTMSLRSWVPGGKARPRPGLSHSAQESAGLPPGPPTSSVALSGKAEGAGEAAVVTAAVAEPRNRRRVIAAVTGLIPVVDTVW